MTGSEWVAVNGRELWAYVVELPPVAWVVMARRVRVVG